MKIQQKEDVENVHHDGGDYSRVFPDAVEEHLNENVIAMLAMPADETVIGRSPRKNRRR